MCLPSSRDPDRQRRAPVALAADRPVDVVLQPVAEAAVLDMLGHPVDRLVVRDQPLLLRRGADVPGAAWRSRAAASCSASRTGRRACTRALLNSSPRSFRLRMISGSASLKNMPPKPCASNVWQVWPSDRPRRASAGCTSGRSRGRHRPARYARCRCRPRATQNRRRPPGRPGRGRACRPAPGTPSNSGS